MKRIKPYVYQKQDWPNFYWDNELLMPMVGEVRNLQGRLLGKMEALGFELRSKSSLKMLTTDIVKSYEIEGEVLDKAQVRSSLARKLGMDLPDLVYSERNVDGAVDMLLDATLGHEKVLTKERLFQWHQLLFPAGMSGMYSILVGQWRDDSTGPMQVVSGALGKEKVHFEAPSATVLEKEMQQFLTWFNEKDTLEPVLKAGLAHFWFVTIHPFEDGNGRIARTLTDMLLTKSDGIPQRFYSMSAQIRVERKKYYELLQACQQGGLDVTKWLVWFLNCLSNALKASDQLLLSVLFKHFFWNKHATTPLNKRQIKVINKLLDGFEGKLTTSKWAKMTKCSSDTALRDIQDLMKKGILKKEAAGGRSTNYELIAVEP